MDVCAICKSSFDENEAVIEPGLRDMAKVHAKCFVCQTCKIPLRLTSLFHIKPLCPTHYWETEIRDAERNYNKAHCKRGRPAGRSLKSILWTAINNSDCGKTFQSCIEILFQILGYAEKRFVVLAEYNNKEKERFFWFCQYDGNQDSLVDLAVKLDYCATERGGDGSTFELDLSRLIPHSLVDHFICFDDFNSFDRHKIFTGKMKKIKVKGLIVDDRFLEFPVAHGCRQYSQLRDMTMDKNLDIMENVLFAGGIGNFFGSKS